MKAKTQNRAGMKKSICLTLIEKLPKILLATAVLICVWRARPGDLPRMLEVLTQSKLFYLTGWIVAIVVIVVAIAAVWIYIKLKPKKG